MKNPNRVENNCSPRISGMSSHRKQPGMSLIELLVTLAVVSILAMMAAPSVQTMIENNQAHSVTNNFLNSLYRTRSEAAKRGNRVTLCASNAAQTACNSNAGDGTMNNFSNGWIVFTDYDGNQTVGDPSLLFDTTGDGNVDSAEEILYASGDPAGNYIIENTGNNSRFKWSITYNSNGLPNTGFGQGYRISKSGSDESQVAKITMGPGTGRVRSCVGDTSKCP